MKKMKHNDTFVSKNHVEIDKKMVVDWWWEMMRSSSFSAAGYYYLPAVSYALPSSALACLLQVVWPAPMKEN